MPIYLLVHPGQEGGGEVWVTFHIVTLDADSLSDKNLVSFLSHFVQLRQLLTLLSMFFLYIMQGMTPAQL